MGGGEGKVSDDSGYGLQEAGAGSDVLSLRCLGDTRWRCVLFIHSFMQLLSQ